MFPKNLAFHCRADQNIPACQVQSSILHPKVKRDCPININTKKVDFRQQKGPGIQPNEFILIPEIEESNMFLLVALLKLKERPQRRPQIIEAFAFCLLADASCVARRQPAASLPKVEDEFPAFYHSKPSNAPPNPIPSPACCLSRGFILLKVRTSDKTKAWPTYFDSDGAKNSKKTPRASPSFRDHGVTEYDQIWFGVIKLKSRLSSMPIIRRVLSSVQTRCWTAQKHVCIDKPSWCSQSNCQAVHTTWSKSASGCLTAFQSENYPLHKSAWGPSQV